MKKTEWFERHFTFGLPAGMLPFFLERLSGTHARMEKKLIGLSDEALSHKLDGKWSIKENIAHLAEVDEIALKRMGEIVEGISPISPAVIQPGRDYNAWPIGKVLDYFQRNRLENLKRYESMSDDDLQKSSLHPRLKQQMTVVDLAWFDAEHDDHHLERISTIRKALTPK